MIIDPLSIPFHINVASSVVAVCCTIFCLYARPWYALAVLIFLMSNCFDLLPKTVFEVRFMDISIVVSICMYIKYMFKFKNLTKSAASFSFAYFCYKTFILIMFVSFLWSIYVYSYPFSLTALTARHMLFGYLLLFLNIKIFELDKNSFAKSNNLIMLIIDYLLFAYIVQYFSGIHIFYGYYIEEQNIIRSIPNFYPILFVPMYRDVCAYLIGQRLSIYSYFRTPLIFTAFILMQTRGTYLAIGISLILMQFFILRHKRIQPTRVIISFSIVAFMLCVLFAGSFISNTIVRRIESTYEAIADASENNRANLQKNTFALRLMLFKERMEMVYAKNIILGYGFIHEDIAQRTLRYRIGTYNKFSIRGSTFTSSDIAWANILIYTGYLGLLSFVTFTFALVISFARRNIGSAAGNISSDNYTLRSGYFYAVLSSLILMANGPAWTTDMQIYAYLLSVYLYLSASQPEVGKA